MSSRKADRWTWTPCYHLSPYLTSLSLFPNDTCCEDKTLGRKENAPSSGGGTPGVQLGNAIPLLGNHRAQRKKCAPLSWWRIQSSLRRRELPTPVKKIRQSRLIQLHCAEITVIYDFCQELTAERGSTTPVCAPHKEHIPPHVCGATTAACFTDTMLMELIPKAMGKYYMGELPSHRFCLLKLSCLIKLIEGIKKASWEEHIHQPALSHSWAGVTSSGSQFPCWHSTIYHQPLHWLLSISFAKY